MPIYRYSVLSENGQPVQGSEAAASTDELRESLARRGYLVQSIQRQGRGMRSRRVRPEDLLLFIQEFCALTRAGMTVTSALELARHRPDSPALGSMLSQALSDVQGGASFHDACAKFPEVFDRLYLSALLTSEKTGDLVGALTRYLSYLRMRVTLRRKVSQALAYPAFLGITMMVVLVVLFIFVLPRFVTIYADFGAALPWPTQLLVATVERGWIVLIGLAAAGVGIWLAWRHWAGNRRFRLAIDRLRMRLPLVGGIFSLLSITQFARSLSSLLAGGTPLLSALQTVGGAVTSRIFSEGLTAVIQQVSAGTSLTAALRQAGLLPETALRMIEVGESSGGLDHMLDEIALYYEEALDVRLTRLMSLLEPIIMLLMGVLIGGIIVVMYLPIFHLADVIK